MLNFFVLQHWDVFLKTTELFILLPILLNLKGNLEMNLAARFSTSVSFQISAIKVHAH